MRLNDAIAHRHGRKLGLAQHLLHLGKYRLGLYALWGMAQVDWTKVERVVFVCTGNILRSPYAEARGASLGARVMSFGLAGREGDRTPQPAVRVGIERGVDLSEHRSRALTAVKPTPSDLIAVMEPRHAELVALQLSARTQIVLLGQFGRPVRPYLQDPYGLSDAYLRTCYAFLDQAVIALVDTWFERRDGVRRWPHNP